MAEGPHLDGKAMKYLGRLVRLQESIDWHDGLADAFRKDKAALRKEALKHCRQAGIRGRDFDRALKIDLAAGREGTR
jgi:hypothetical protein